MRLYLVAFAAAALLTANAQTPAVEAEPLVLSLDQCISIALSDNPTIKVADMEIQRTDYSKIETLSQLLPQISFGGQYSRTLAKQTMYMSLSGMGGGNNSGEGGDETGEGSTSSSRASGGSNGIKVGMDNSYQVGFSASMPLIAPQLWASLKLSDAQILQAVEQSRASKLDLVNQVKDAYYALMLANDSKTVINESYEMAKLTHEIYTKKFQAGAASDYEVLRTSVAMKNIEPELLQADIAIKKARLQLLILMGMDAGVNISTDSSLSKYEGSMYEDVMGLSRDYSQNSDLMLNTIQNKQLAQALKIQQYSLIPTLSLTANYFWTSMQNGSPFENFRWSPYSTVGLSLSIPLFTGGSRYSKIKQAQVQLNEMQYVRENLERNVSSQVDLAIDNIHMNVKQIASSSESVGEAERAHDIMQQSFGIGAASYLDLRDSELALTRARLTYYQSIYNYLVARSGLELLLGNAPLETYKTTQQ